MRTIFLTTTAAALLVGSAHAETFDFTLEQFRTKLNGIIQSDTSPGLSKDANTVKNCKVTKVSTECYFSDVGFQSSVSEFKKMNLMNGRFKLQGHLSIASDEGKVDAITIQGDRSDPANLFWYVGTVMDVVQVFDPEALKTYGSTASLSTKLGLMRGDDADDIGKLRTDIEDYALIKCGAEPSGVSTAVACIFLPRS